MRFKAGSVGCGGYCDGRRHAIRPTCVRHPYRSNPLKAVRSSTGSPTGFGQSKYGGSGLLTFSSHSFFPIFARLRSTFADARFPPGRQAGVDADLRNLTRGNDR